MSRKDPKKYYQLFGLENNQFISDSEVSKIYSEKVKKYHPDLNKNDPEKAKKFSEISEAFSKIKTKKLRDQYESSEEESSGFGGFGDLGMNFFEDLFNSSSSSSNNYFEFEDSFFHQNNTNTKSSSSNKIFEIKVPIDQVLKEENIKIEYLDIKFCHNCRHGRCASNTACTKCRGRGYITSSLSNYAFFENVKQECNQCMGTGRQLTYCKLCNGTGQILEKKIDYIIIPKTTKNKDKLKFKNKIFIVNIQVPQNYQVDWKTGDVLYHKNIGLKEFLTSQFIRIKGIDQNIYKIKMKSSYIENMTSPIIIKNLGYFHNLQRGLFKISLILNFSDITKEQITDITNLLKKS